MRDLQDLKFIIWQRMEKILYFKAMSFGIHMSLSYIPNEKAFPEKAYEVESARVAPGGGEVLAVAASRLLTELFPRP